MDSTPGRESCRKEAFGVNWQRSKQPNRYLVTVCYCSSLWTTVCMVDDAVVSLRSLTTTTTHHHQQPFILHTSISNQSIILFSPSHRHCRYWSTVKMPIKDFRSGLSRTHRPTIITTATSVDATRRGLLPKSSPPSPFACFLLRNPRFCP